MLQLTTLIQENSLEFQQCRLIKHVKAFANKQNLSELEINNHISWILRFIRFHNKQHPIDLNQQDIEAFLSTLATKHNYDATIQTNAANSLNFLYKDFLQIDLTTFRYLKTKIRRGFADRFCHQDCTGILNQMRGVSLLMAELAYYGKLKLREVVDLRLTNINIKKNEIKIMKKNGEIKFVLNIPIRLIIKLRIQTMRVDQLVQIKTRQLITAGDKISDPLEVKQNEYLFPVANSENPHISSRLMQLVLLKNDIKIATKQYLRFSTINQISRKQAAKSSTNIEKNAIKVNHIESNTFERLKFVKSSLSKTVDSKNNSQISFDFKNLPSTDMSFAEDLKLEMV